MLAPLVQEFRERCKIIPLRGEIREAIQRILVPLVRESAQRGFVEILWSMGSACSDRAATGSPRRSVLPDPVPSALPPVDASPAVGSIEGMASFVRTATDADLDLLAGIEEEADQVFASLFGPLGWGAAPTGHDRAAESGFLLVVAEEDGGAPVGFVHVLEQDGVAHLEQLSVLPAHGRRGHGRALVDAALDEAADRGYAVVTLRTFADVPWNAPFYASLGFEERPVPDHPFHRGLVDTEQRIGLDRQGARVHMEFDLDEGGMEMDPDAFEALVIDELDRLPDDMIDGLDNVVFVVEDRPEDGSLDLLGLYDGLAVTERGNYGMGELPDRIIVYREPHLAQCADEQELRAEVHTTLVHEIAHFYGIDDAQLHELGWA